MANVYQKSVFAAAGAGVALGCTVIGANPAAATIINYDFTVTITEGVLVGNQYSGSLSYDDSSDLTSYGGFPLADFNFDFEGKTFSELDLLIDVAGYGGFFPDEGFDEGLVTASVGLYDDPFQPQDFPKIIFLGSTFFGYLGDCSGSSCDFGPESFGQVTYEVDSPSTSIPEPGTVGSLFVFGLGSLLLKKKVVSSESK